MFVHTGTGMVVKFIEKPTAYTIASPSTNHT